MTPLAYLWAIVSALEDGEADVALALAREHLADLCFEHATRRRYPPLIAIEFGIEATPRVRSSWSDDSGRARLVDWIAGTDDVFELFEHAADVARARGARA